MAYVPGSATAASTNAGSPFTVASSARTVQFTIGTAGPAGNRFVDAGATDELTLDRLELEVP